MSVSFGQDIYAFWTEYTGTEYRSTEYLNIEQTTQFNVTSLHEPNNIMEFNGPMSVHTFQLRKFIQISGDDKYFVLREVVIIGQ